MVEQKVDVVLIRKQLKDACQQYMHMDLPGETIDYIFSISTIKCFSDSEIICQVGDSLNYTGMVLSGIVRSYFLTPDGKDISRFFHVQYSMVMDDTLLGFEKSQYMCEAVGDVMILLFPADKIKKKIHQDPVLKEIYLHGLENGLRYKLYRENEFMTKDATRRYQQFVLDFPKLVQKVKQAHIATYLGIEPQSLSRIRKSLRENEPT